MPAPKARSVVVATPAFARTKCRVCSGRIVPDQALVSTTEGFAHLGCHMTRPQARI